MKFRFHLNILKMNRHKFNEFPLYIYYYDHLFFFCCDSVDWMALPRDTWPNPSRWIHWLLSNDSHGMFYRDFFLAFSQEMTIDCHFCLQISMNRNRMTFFSHLFQFFFTTYTAGVYVLLLCVFLVFLIFTMKIDKQKCWNSHYHWRIWWINKPIFSRNIAYQIRNEMQMSNENQLPNRLNNNIQWRNEGDNNNWNKKTHNINVDNKRSWRPNRRKK